MKNSQKIPRGAVCNDGLELIVIVLISLLIFLFNKISRLLANERLGSKIEILI
jgi:hypothetical protein